jgi:hypothetical protein
VPKFHQVKLGPFAFLLLSIHKGACACQAARGVALRSDSNAWQVASYESEVEGRTQLRGFVVMFLMWFRLDSKGGGDTESIGVELIKNIRDSSRGNLPVVNCCRHVVLSPRVSDNSLKLSAARANLNVESNNCRETLWLYLSVDHFQTDIRAAISGQC